MAQVQTQVRRRIRTRNDGKLTGTVTPSNAKKRLDELTREARDAETIAAAAQRKADAAKAEALRLMQLANIDAHQCPYGDLKVTIPSGRSSTYIDPREYHEAVDDDAFYGSVSVSITKARQHLAGKEFDQIAEVTEGKAGEPKLKTEYYWPTEDEE